MKEVEKNELGMFCKIRPEGRILTLSRKIGSVVV
jgi:hypothetical protein